MKQKVLKGCKPEDTHCGTALCMCRTPGSWIGSFLTLKIAALQKHNPTRVFMGVLPGSGDISLRRFWEELTCFLGTFPRDSLVKVRGNQHMFKDSSSQCLLWLTCIWPLCHALISSSPRAFGLCVTARDRTCVRERGIRDGCHIQSVRPPRLELHTRHLLNYVPHACLPFRILEASSMSQRNLNSPSCSFRLLEPDLTFSAERPKSTSLVLPAHRITETFLRNCGGIRDDSQHLTFTAHMDLKKCQVGTGADYLKQIVKSVTKTDMLRCTLSILLTNASCWYYSEPSVGGYVTGMWLSGSQTRERFGAFTDCGTRRHVFVSTYLDNPQQIHLNRVLLP
eukprot:1186542-Prorocentrum_minimum.AAC.2